ncbi:MAG: gliding motility protein GldM [Flavisolibacter sp.]|nr:gliding motility protein GldM [Flavisolibacter sp.]
MALPREPRQKMINMMYLVLTALLALNVSAEILNAFKTVNNSLEKTNGVVGTSTANVMQSFQRKLNDPTYREQAQKWYPKAEQAISYSKALYDYIDGLKSRILTDAGYNPAAGKTTFKEDNLDVATRLMVEGRDGKKLYSELQQYQKNILAIDPTVAQEFKTNLPIDLTMPKTQNKGNNTWEAAYFRMVPTVAALTMLSKFQNDVRTTENRVVTYLHNKVGQVEVVYDAYAAVVGQSSSYLIPGQELEITAGVGAFNKQAAPEISIGGTGVRVGDDGVARMKLSGGGVGSHSLPVTIRFKDQMGNIQTVNKTIEWTVGQTSAAVALDKMNVLFIGVDNPVTISASGDINKVNASISQGSLTKVGQGRYIARVNSDGECTITITSDGKTSSFPFRVRSIPDPTPMVGMNKSGSNMAAGAFKSQAGVRALLENFFYEAQFNVTGFRIIGEGEGFDDFQEATNSGAAWGPQAQAIVNRVRPGSIITIEDIRCVGPDGRSRKLPSVFYNIK